MTETSPAESRLLPEVEIRFTTQPVALRGAGGQSRRIGGYAAVFRSVSENLGGFVEMLDHRFFAKAKGDGWPGVICRFNHDDAMLLGAVHSQTLSLDVDNRGLSYTVDLPRSRDDVLESISRGDVRNSSFAFAAFEDDWTISDGLPLRTLLSGRLIDVSPVVTPAYRDSTVALRSLADYADAPVEDVVSLASSGDLRKLLCRTGDRRPVPGGGGHGHRLTTRAQQPRDGRQALLDVMAKRWPEEPAEPKSGRLAYVELMGRRWEGDTETLKRTGRR